MEKPLAIKKLEENKEGSFDPLIENETFKVLVITGREASESEFYNRIAPYLYDNFAIRGAYALGKPEDIDDTEWFICFVAGNETDLWNVEDQEKRITRKDEKGRGQLTISIFDDMDEALEHAREEFGFEYGAEIQAFRSRAKDVYEKFGFSTAQEIERFQIFMALAGSGALVLTRGLLSDTQVPVVALTSEGSDGLKVKPIAILMSSDILESLELPAISNEGFGEEDD